MLETMKYLRFPLPEDIEKAKLSGSFGLAEKLIDIRLKDESVPYALKQRLRIEKEVLARLPQEYPYEKEEALNLVREEIPDYTMEELEGFMERGDADWFMIDGRPHLQRRFFESLKKVYPFIAERAGQEKSSAKLLDDIIHEMKTNGSASRHIRIRHTFRIRDEFFEPGRVLVHLPVPAACMNMKDIRILHTDPCDAYVSDANHESRTVSFETELRENRTFSVEYSYTSCVKYVNPDPKDAVIRSYDIPENELSYFLTDGIRILADELGQGETNPLLLARRFYDFVTENVVYSFMREYIALGNIPEYCASRLRGDCGVQALLFIALCLSKGIPAKWQSGKYAAPDHCGNHDWAMFYCEPWGWLFADCSFGGSAYRAGSKERHDFYFGNLDPFRMAANNGFMKEFDPPKRHWRIDPYDNQSGEAEYTERGLSAEETESVCEVLEII